MLKNFVKKMIDMLKTMLNLVIYNVMFEIKYPRYSEEMIREMVSSAPEMTFKSDMIRDQFMEFKKINSKDEWGLSIIEFAESWARLAEAEKAKGRILTPGLILECGEIADHLYGSSGWSYATAKNILFTYWKYGAGTRFIRN